MTVSLLRTVNVLVRRYEETTDKGVLVNTLVEEFETKGALMPAAKTTMAVNSTETLHLVDENVEREYQYSRIFTKVPLRLKDVVIDVEKNEEYKVIREFDYIRYGTYANHYSATLAREI